MYKKLAYSVILIGVVAAAAAIGCGGGGGGVSPDFSMKGDAGPGSPDLSVMKMYASATPHDVDTNTIGGPFDSGAAVKLTGLIVISPITGFSAKSGADCEFEVWAQDPTCTVPPCGIVLESNEITNPGGTGAYCDYTGAAMTTLKGIKQGDQVDVNGVVDTFPSTGMANDMSPSGTVVQHEIQVDSFMSTASGQTLPAPMVVTDTNPSLFVPYSGAGWAMYEGMLITLEPASGKFTTTLNSFGGWTCAPGGATYADTFTGLFRPDGAAVNMWPPNGSMFSSISGIVGLTFGGAILPDSNSDFVD
jgi:hypothetical protein